MKIIKLILIILLINYADFYEESFDSDESEPNKEPDELVEELIERFDSLSETSVDLAEKLKKITEASAAFLKLGIPLGGLISASLDIVSKPDSPEYKALKKMNEHMLYQFDRLSERITYSFEAEEMDTELREFQSFITIQLDVLVKEALYFIDPSKAKGSDSIAHLLSYCAGTNGILKMAKYMKTRVTVGCELENTFVFVKISNLWGKLENKYNNTDWSHNEIHLKKHIIKFVHSMRAYKALRLIEEAEKMLFGELEHVFSDFSTLENALKYIFNLVKHRKLRKNPTRCLTDAVFNGNKYNRIKIAFFEALVQIELSRLLMSANVCGKFMFPDLIKLENFLNDVLADIKATSQFLVEYVPKKLNVSQEVEKIIVSDVIKNFKSSNEETDIAFEKYSELSELIYKELKNIGIKSLEKQILLTTAETIKGFNTLFICPEFYCYSVLNQRGVNILVAKFYKDELFMAESFMESSEKSKPKILEVLKSKYYMELPALLKEFKTKNFTTVEKNFGRSAAIIRHKTFFLSKCKFTSVEKLYIREPWELPNMRSLMYANYADRGVFDDNTCFEIKLFL